MGRELRRKEEKRNKHKNNTQKQVDIDTGINGITLLKVCSASVLVLFVVYYILAVFFTKEIDISEKDSNNNGSSNTSSNNVASNVSNLILAQNIFNQKEETYYVYCYDFADEDENVANAINSKTDITIYRVDTKSSLNNKYVTTESGNRSASNLEELEIKNPTLLEISGDRITKYYEGRNEIINFLNE